jgi:DNA-binding NtrC family response regulator
MNSALQVLPAARSGRIEYAVDPTVTGQSCSSHVLIVDHDMGFVMWLGTLFTELGRQAVPALHCRQALAMIQRMDLPVSILVIDPELRGAKRLIQRVVAANPALRLVLIGNSGNSDNSAPTKFSGLQARFTLQRPSPMQAVSRAEWATKIRKLIADRG